MKHPSRKLVTVAVTSALALSGAGAAYACEGNGGPGTYPGGSGSYPSDPRRPPGPPPRSAPRSRARRRPHVGRPASHTPRTT